MTAKSNTPATIQEQLRNELANLGNRVAPPSGNNISLKGGVFNLPDGTTHKGPLECIILDWRIVNAFYTGPYDPQNPKPPKCWAISEELDAAAPPDEVEEKQAEACNVCPMNEFGSAPTGKGKACKNQRRLAVVPLDATAETQPMTLTVSPSGLGKFESYVVRLGGPEFEAMPIQMMTRIGFDANVTYPSLIFSPGDRVPEDRLNIMMTLRQAAQPLLDRGFPATK